MQIATLSYHTSSKDNIHCDSKLSYHHRHIFTTIANSPKKQKQRRSDSSDVNSNGSSHLPPVISNPKHSSSMRVRGNGFSSLRLNDSTSCSFYQPTHAHSRLSDKNEIGGARSGSVTPSVVMQPVSKHVSLRFGYPVKFRPSDFYSPSYSDAELRLREDSFIRDSVRCAHQPSAISPYEALNDPNLKQFFHSPLVLDVIRKTLNIDLSDKLSDTKKQPKSADKEDDYRRIIAKHSSGYAKLNGYNCIPPNAPGRHGRSTTNDKYQSSINSSFISFPTNSSFQVSNKKPSRLNNKSKRLTPIAVSSAVVHQPEVTNDALPVSNATEE